MKTSIRIASEGRQPAHVPLFRLRLGSGGSIGPVALKRVWSSAAQSSMVSVSREAVGRGGSHYTYILSGPAHLALPGAPLEQEIRRLLLGCLVTAHIELSRIV